MTVAKLIEMLQKEDPQAKLYVWDSELDIVSYVDGVVEDSFGFVSKLSLGKNRRTKMPRLAILLTREDLTNLQYPIVVEMWDKVKGSYSKRRKYLAEFTEYERKKVKELYLLFYRWYLVKGTPDEYMVRNWGSYLFMERVVHFFATV